MWVLDELKLTKGSQKIIIIITTAAMIIRPNNRQVVTTLLKPLSTSLLWNLEQHRGYPTLREIQTRLKSVRSTQKITLSMKLVSAAKYARAERELKNARPFGVGAQAFYEKAEIKIDDLEEQQQTPKDISKVIVAVTSDRGLCGGIHSGVGKAVRKYLENPVAGKELTRVFCVGDKSRSLLQRLYSENLLITAKEIGRSSSDFSDGAAIAQALLNSGYNYDGGKIVYNKFNTAASYTCTSMPFYSMAVVGAAPKLSLYDSLDPDVLQSYLEFSLAALMYYALKENACSEQSSRMAAMDNSSKNAGEMIDKLAILFNRSRQAVITQELSEIVAGAAALT